MVGPRCPACGALASLAVDGPAEGTPAVLPPGGRPPGVPPAYAYPPPGYAYPPPGYGYPPMPYGYPPPGYGHPPPRPGIGVLAILVLVANYGAVFLGGLVAIAALADGPSDATERAGVFAISALATAAWLTGSIGIHRARAWGAITSIVTWGATAGLFAVAIAATPRRDEEAIYGMITIVVGCLGVALLAGLSLPQLKRRREWRAS